MDWYKSMQQYTCLASLEIYFFVIFKMWPEIHLHSLSSLISAEEPLYGIPLLPFPPSALRLHKDDLSPRCAITIFMLLFLPA